MSQLPIYTLTDLWGIIFRGEKKKGNGKYNEEAKRPRGATYLTISF